MEKNLHVTTIRIPEDLYKFLKVYSVINDYKSTNDLITAILLQYKQEKED